MKALILNSGMGSRMLTMTEHNPKCMVELVTGETILTRQLRQLKDAGITDVVMTTGYKARMIEGICNASASDVKFNFVENPEYRTTNYIYSIYLAKDFLHDDLLLLHGDLVFDDDMITDLMSVTHSCMTVSRSRPLPPKDFKAEIKDNKIASVSINQFENALYAQPLYKLNRADWETWLCKIEQYCTTGIRGCYAEEALNEIINQLYMGPFDVDMRLCMEVDTPDDLRIANHELRR